MTTTNDIYERLACSNNWCAIPTRRPASRFPIQDTGWRAGPTVRPFLAAGDKMGAVKAYRDEAGVDRPL